MAAEAPRGADLVARALADAGARTIFSLSGNQIMPLFDAGLEAGLAIVHVRHEAAAVHMAEAWAQVTGEVGVALVTAGPGFANGLAAIHSARASESPVLILAGDSPLAQEGRGAFQAMDQVAIAGPVAKASRRAHDAGGLGRDVASALATAKAGRPGPVHLALPFDLLEARPEAIAAPENAPPSAMLAPLTPADAEAVSAGLARAARPLILAGPSFARPWARAARTALEQATGLPVVALESPRGLRDPTIGRLPALMARADLVLALGKPLDFQVGFARPPAFTAECRFVAIDADLDVLLRARAAVGGRLVVSARAEPREAAVRLAAIARHRPRVDPAWAAEVAAALAWRPPEWRGLASDPDGPVHPLDLARAVRDALADRPEPIAVLDGGEVGQWAQAIIAPPTRIVNGPGGAIGAAIPYAIGAARARPDATVIAVSGDGAAGFHLMEFDTAVRAGLAFVVVVGNDARWNAEHQIQLRDYGPGRAFACDLGATRYDLIAEALGGHGEHVGRPADLAPALARALASGRPALVNVAIESLAAPSWY